MRRRAKSYFLESRYLLFTLGQSVVQTPANVQKNQLFPPNGTIVYFTMLCLKLNDTYVLNICSNMILPYNEA